MTIYIYLNIGWLVAGDAFKYRTVYSSEYLLNLYIEAVMCFFYIVEYFSVM